MLENVPEPGSTEPTTVIMKSFFVSHLAVTTKHIELWYVHVHLDFGLIFRVVQKKL